MTFLDKTWHLTQTEDEIKLTEFELQLWRVFFSFLRWQQECERAVNGTNLLGQDLSVLHIIRMKDRPKSIADIARLLNRDDDFNIQYSVRKLLKLGLINKSKLAGSKSIVYIMTPLGIENTNKMARARKSVLVDMFINKLDVDLESLAQALIKFKTIYSDAEHTIAS